MAYERFRLKTFAVTLTGAADPLTTADTATGHLVIQSSIGNAGTVYVGASDVSTSNGIALVAGASFRLDSTQWEGQDLDILMKDIFVIGTAADTVRVGYYEPYKS